MFRISAGVARAAALAIVLALSSAGESAGQSSASSFTPPAATPEADSLFARREWAAAARAYEEVAKQRPTSGRAWSRVGTSYHSLGNYAKAASALERAVEVAPNNPVFLYNLACALARGGQREKALGALERAAAAGFNDAKLIASDADLASLRDDARFKKILATVDRNVRPCATQPEARQFDYWVGDWEVRALSGDIAGTNRIELILGDCVLLENWTSASGGSGKSINVFHPEKKKWQQTWVDQSGGVTEYIDGEYKDNRMQFGGTMLGPDGRPVQLRLTFFNLGPDRVRQFAEQSVDAGKTWTVQYDLMYLRRK